jgi:hypothetical protein
MVTTQLTFYRRGQMSDERKDNGGEEQGLHHDRCQATPVLKKNREQFFYW